MENTFEMKDGSRRYWNVTWQTDIEKFEIEYDFLDPKYTYKQHTIYVDVVGENEHKFNFDFDVSSDCFVDGEMVMKEIVKYLSQLALEIAFSDKRYTDVVVAFPD